MSSIAATVSLRCAFVAACMILPALHKSEAQTFPNFGGPQQALAAVQTTCAPAAANYNGVTYIAYNQNSNGVQDLAVATGNGSGFSNYVIDTDQFNLGSAVCSPALALFNGNFYAAYANSSGQLEILKFAPQNQGSYFPIATVLNVGGMTTSPAMVVYKNRLEIIYGAGGNHAFSVSDSTDGLTIRRPRTGLVLLD